MRGHAAVPVRRVHPGGGLRRRPTCGGSSPRWRAPRERRASRSSPATPRSSQRGKADGCYINTAGVGVIERHRPLGVDPGPARRRGARVRADRRARHRHHAGPRRARHRGRHRTRTPPRCTAWWRRCWTPSPQVRGLRDADPRRGGHRAQRGGGRPGRRGAGRGVRYRSGPRCAARASCSASTRCTSPARAGWSRWSTAMTPTRRWPPCAAHPLGAGAAIIGWVREDPPGLVLLKNRLRRHPHRGPAGRRPAAADLLIRVQYGSFSRRGSRSARSRAAATTAWPRLIPPSLQGTPECSRTRKPRASRRADGRPAAAGSGTRRRTAPPCPGRAARASAGRPPRSRGHGPCGTGPRSPRRAPAAFASSTTACRRSARADRERAPGLDAGRVRAASSGLRVGQLLELDRGLALVVDRVPDAEDRRDRVEQAPGAGGQRGVRPRRPSATTASQRVPGGLTGRSSGSAPP